MSTRLKGFSRRYPVLFILLTLRPRGKIGTGPICPHQAFSSPQIGHIEIDIPCTLCQTRRRKLKDNPIVLFQPRQEASCSFLEQAPPPVSNTRFPLFFPHCNANAGTSAFRSFYVQHPHVCSAGSLALSKEEVELLPATQPHRSGIAVGHG